MKIDIGRHIGAVSRRLENREHEGRMARVALASRTYDTTIDDPWEAITSAERIPRRFLPISGDLRLGGRYQLTGNAGGTITRCEPPRLLAVTWEYGGETSWVTVMLAADGAGTRLELEHMAHVKDEFWDQYGPGAVGVGWDLGILGLALYVARGGAFNRAEAEAWSTSDEGKAFARGCSEEWCRASIAAGTDPAAAKAAAARTSAFYTGEAPA